MFLVRLTTHHPGTVYRFRDVSQLDPYNKQVDGGVIELCGTKEERVLLDTQNIRPGGSLFLAETEPGSFFPT